MPTGLWMSLVPTQNILAAAQKLTFSRGLVTWFNPVASMQRSDPSPPIRVTEYHLISLVSYQDGLTQTILSMGATQGETLSMLW